MSATTQHKFHPDTESLNAFAEQALGERERGEVLEHLAVCGRCRQIVSLAREAAEGEVSAAKVARRLPGRPRAWRRSWGLALAPAAALAATAAVLIAVHVREVEQRAERSAEMAKVESQSAPENATPAPKASQPQQAEAAPAAGPPVMAAPELKAKKAERPSEAARTPEPVAAPEMPAGSFDLPVTGRFHGEAEPRAAPLSSAEEHGFAPEPETSPERPAASNAPVATAAFHEKQKKQAEAEVAERQMLAAKAEARGGAQGGVSGAQQTSEQVVVTAQGAPPEQRTVPASSISALTNLTPGAFSSARMANPILLPNGRFAVSVARAGARILALDKAGGLFLSEDQGGTWEPVTKQWTGCAVTVRRQVAASSIREAAPGAGAGSAGKGADTGAAPGPPVVFEILNDQSHVWWSTDGKIWTAR